jgi:hypothetical protein
MVPYGTGGRDFVILYTISRKVNIFLKTGLQFGPPPPLAFPIRMIIFPKHAVLLNRLVALGKERIHGYGDLLDRRFGQGPGDGQENH